MAIDFDRQIAHVRSRAQRVADEIRRAAEAEAQAELAAAEERAARLEQMRDLLTSQVGSST